MERGGRADVDEVEVLRGEERVDRVVPAGARTTLGERRASLLAHIGCRDDLDLWTGEPSGQMPVERHVAHTDDRASPHGSSRRKAKGAGRKAERAEERPLSLGRR